MTTRAGQKRLHQERQLRDILFESPIIAGIMARFNEIELPNAHLCAGCITQSIWNALTGRAPDHGIEDIDLIYFDAEDLSEDAEATNARRITDLFADIDRPFDVKNEARVHCWYEAKFGKPLAPYSSIPDAVASFPTTATSLAVRPLGEDIGIVAPFGLSDLFARIVRPNKLLVTQSVYEAKIERWRRYWPELIYLPWQEPDQEA